LIETGDAQKILAVATIIALSPLLANAQMSHGNHGGHGGHGAQPQPSTDSTSPSTKAYETANERMHQEMMIQFTGDADKDFIAGMIPHHRGTVDMAAILLKYGKNPRVRELAEQIIREQEKEIILMEELLKELNQ
jgi:uncharacterized protein (DUF305 family)